MEVYILCREKITSSRSLILSLVIRTNTKIILLRHFLKMFQSQLYNLLFFIADKSNQNYNFKFVILILFWYKSGRYSSKSLHIWYYIYACIFILYKLKNVNYLSGNTKYSFPSYGENISKYRSKVNPLTIIFLLYITI